MRPEHREQAERCAPFVIAYALGMLTFWGASILFGQPVNELHTAYFGDSGLMGDAASAESRSGAFGERGQLEATPENLRAVARRGNISAVRRLIARDIDLNAADYKGRSPLILAAGGGQSRIVGVLITAGAKLNATTKSGRTALMAAAKRGDADSVKLLLRHGALLSSKNQEGATAHDLAIEYKQDEVARLIEEAIDQRNQERIQVTRVQFVLAKLGYRPGGIDGNLGPKTQEAILKFQRENKLEPDGRVSDQLLAALEERQRIFAVKGKTAGSRAVASASRRALRNASATRKQSAKDKKSKGGGFFSRAGKWLRNNSTDADADAASEND